MIKWLICVLWGHKTTAKAYTGQTMDARSYAGLDQKVSLYKWHRSEHCLRCGKRVHKHE